MESLLAQNPARQVSKHEAQDVGLWAQQKTVTRLGGCIGRVDHMLVSRNKTICLLVYLCRLCLTIQPEIIPRPQYEGAGEVRSCISIFSAAKLESQNINMFTIFMEA